MLGRGGRRRQAVTRNGNVAAEEYGSADNSSEEYDNFEDGKQSESSSDEDESGSGQGREIHRENTQFVPKPLKRL